MSGLMMYLVGPGRENEHSDPHLVGGDPALLAWHADAELGRDSALSIAAHLDQPRTAFDVEVSRGHVWHCSLSIRAEEGLLTDERWGEIASDFVRLMGFDDNEETKAPCRWAAVRHGLSKAGNDHVHLVVNLVREDGTKAAVFNDFRKAQEAARALEVRYGLERLESVDAARSTRGYHPAELQAQARARARAKHNRASLTSSEPSVPWGSLEPSTRARLIAAEASAIQPRVALALKVRAAAAESVSEDEFVRRLRRKGLLVRPRFADGRSDVVSGFSVAEHPQAGERPIWYGGGHLGRDLALPRLRHQWPDTPETASLAAREWTAAGRSQRVVAPGREQLDVSPELWDLQAVELTQLVDRLKEVAIDDHVTWSSVARQASGALAAWSNATEGTPGDLAAAAEALSRSAQTHRSSPLPTVLRGGGLTGAAMVLARASSTGGQVAAQAVMVRQLLRLTQAIYEASKSSHQARHAALLASDTRARLVRVRDAMPNPRRVEVRATETHLASARRTQPAEVSPQIREMLNRLEAGRPSDDSVRAPVLPKTLSSAKPTRGEPAPANKSAER